jgi:hypothetical protein
LCISSGEHCITAALFPAGELCGACCAESTVKAAKRGGIYSEAIASLYVQPALMLLVGRIMTVPNFARLTSARCNI